jgi:uncharacterized damage-inducible protein DinB
MKKTEWFKRTFQVIPDNGILPSILERLIGTPARLEEITRNLNEFTLTSKEGKKWSIKEEVGHLSDLEPLWLGRLEELMEGLKELSVADLTNRQTHTANHNAIAIEILLRRFREQRMLFVDKLMYLSDEQLNFAALHPRLRTPMRIIDLSYFVAEHDDHHMARIREILQHLF